MDDILTQPATEVARMLDSTVESVTSALKRARATLESRIRNCPETMRATSSTSLTSLIERSWPTASGVSAAVPATGGVSV